MPSVAEQGDLQRVLGRIEGKIDGIYQRMDHLDAHNTECDQRQVRLEVRVGAAEKKIWTASGAAAVAGAALGLFVRYFSGGSS